ncbi:MAG TPA: hypothetical protein VIL20_21190, partial [Sandaracinaceae bacterium]
MVDDAACESLIVLSDVHLGSDLGAPRGAREKAIDRELARLLDHYRESPPPRGRWRLVIAGDFIDFIGMVLPLEVAEHLETPPNEEERRHGLGNARDHALAKMRAVAARHRMVFEALGRFVANGHALTIIRGNHDLELYWDEVRAELTETILRAARRHAPGLDVGEARARIDYSPWFFYREGVAYIEHGHQYDTYCATEHLLAPLAPNDPRRIARGFSDVLLRFVVRQTPGLSEHGHERMGVLDYLRFGVRLGASGMVALALRYARAIRELFRLRRAYLRGATRELRAQHMRAMARFARATRVGLGRVRELHRLQVPPITRSFFGILESVLLDRLLLALVCIALLVASAVAAAFEPALLTGTAGVAAGWIAGQRWLAKRRKVDPADELAARAHAVASLFRVPY